MGRVRPGQGDIVYVSRHRLSYGRCLTNGGNTADALASYPKQTSTHLALSALFGLEGHSPGSPPTVELLREQVQRMVGSGVELPEALNNALGEL